MSDSSSSPQRRRRSERHQLDLFRALPGDLAARDAQDLMAYPFFSLAKSKRIIPIDFRVDAGRRLWRALNGRPLGPPLHAQSESRRRRLSLALRALDARMDGSTYREIAEVLFGSRRISERDWKTHDLRNRTIRLVQSGFALMRGGYRALLRPTSRKK